MQVDPGRKKQHHMKQNDSTDENRPAPHRGPTGQNATNTFATTVAGREEGGDTRCS